MRVATVVDRELFIKAVQESESGGPLENLNALHRRVADIYNSYQVPAPITFSVAGSRIQEYTLVVQTQAGRRGRPSGQMSDEHKQKLREGRLNNPRKLRREKYANNPKIQAGFKELRATLSELANGSSKFDNLVSRIEKGSTKAALTANCFLCIGGSYRDAKNCQESCCPFYALTCGVFKRGQVEQDDQGENVLNETDEEIEDSAAA